MTRRCLIAGCGYVGRRLAHRLRAAWQVAAIARSEASLTPLRDAGIEVHAMDFDSAQLPEELGALADGAAIAYLAPPPETGRSDPRLGRFLAALGRARPSVLLYMSTTGVYGDTRGASVSESSPVAPGNDRSRRRVDAEQQAMAWCRAHDVRCVVLRVPGIYGPHRLPVARLMRGEPALRPEDAGPGNRIHVDDLVSACGAALERTVRGVINVGDGDCSSTTVFLLATARLAGLPAPPLVSMEEARGRIGPGMLSFLVESRRVELQRMHEELEVRPRYPTLEAGIQASLAEMRAQAE
jgi:nucleoside-diphosphate-sugar epimerase